MNSRTLRARIVLDEARALGIDLADLIAADGAGAALPVLAAYLDEIAVTFTASTAARAAGATLLPGRHMSQFPTSAVYGLTFNHRLP